MNLAGKEDYKGICEDARLEDRAPFELITPRIYELGGQLPADIRAFADRAGCPDAYLVIHTHPRVAMRDHRLACRLPRPRG